MAALVWDAATKAGRAAPESAGHRRTRDASTWYDAHTRHTDPRRPAAKPLTREEALAQSPRVPIETPRLSGSIALKGGRIDDLSLNQYRETVDPKSPPIVLLAPSRSPHPLYAEFGWLTPSGTTAKRPDDTTLWTQQGSGPLTINQPLQLAYDNGEGLEFRRTISVDDKYVFTIRDEVANKGSAPVALHPFGLISRHGTPKLEGYLVSHEGFVGVLADKVQEEKYADVEKKKSIEFQNTQGWLVSPTNIGRNPRPQPQRQDQRPLPIRPAWRAQDLPGRLFSRDRQCTSRDKRRSDHPDVRRRQGSRGHRRLQRCAQA